MRKGPLITKQTFAACCPWTAPIFARPERLAQDVLSYDLRASDSPRLDGVLEAGRCRPRVFLDFATGKSLTFLLMVVWCGALSLAQACAGRPLFDFFWLPQPSHITCMGPKKD